MGKKLTGIAIILILNACKVDHAGSPLPISTDSPPSISSINPQHAKGGDNITIAGSNFSVNSDQDAVNINGVVATVIKASTNSIEITVPLGVGSGGISVTVNSRTAIWNDFYYDYTTVSSLPANSLFSSPIGICVDSKENLYITDAGRARVNKIDGKTGIMTTLAGSGLHGYTDGVGTAAEFNDPQGICIDLQGNLYVTEPGNNRIRKITAAGVVTTLAGAVEGYADGTGTAAKFAYPLNICADSKGYLYVTDFFNNRIRKISPTGEVTTIAGSSVGYADGVGLNAKFNQPAGICIDPQGNLYVADESNNRIRKINPSGMVTTIAGNGTGGFINGVAAEAEFHGPLGLCIDAGNNLYLTDYFNNSVREISSVGVVTLLAGRGGIGYTDGGGSIAEFNGLFGICVDQNNNLYVTDEKNNLIRKIVIL
jgi:sugar lactone lactonase YvrE